MKRWSTLTLVAVAAAGLLASAAVRADIPGYTLSMPVKIGGAISDASAMQMGDVNNKGQFAVNFSSGDAGGELEWVWDGANLVQIADPNKTLPDGATVSGGNTWSPTGINDNGKVAWVVDIADGGTGPHYVVVYDIATKETTIVARPGDDPAGDGIKLGDQAAAPSGGRMVADINNLDQVFWCQARAGADGSEHTAVFMVDLKQKKGAVMVANGMKSTDGKTITDAWWPDANDSSQVAMCASVDADSSTFGIYLAGNGSITPIIPSGSTIDGQKIGSARWPRLANNGDIVAVVDLNNTENGGATETGDDIGVAYYSAADKTLHLIVKPGDAVPGGTFHGLEPSRRVVGVTDNGAVWFLGVREDGADGVYRWQAGKIEALVLGNTSVPGLGKVEGVTRGIGGVSGYHFGVSGKGYVAFPAVVDGVEGYVLATPPAQ
jgi:hypothetical protein